MKLYKIDWCNFMGHWLSAVVAADDEQQALSECGLPDHAGSVSVKQIGEALDGLYGRPETVAKESL